MLDTLFIVVVMIAVTVAVASLVILVASRGERPARHPGTDGDGGSCSASREAREA